MQLRSMLRLLDLPAEQLEAEPMVESDPRLRPPGSVLAARRVVEAAREHRDVAAAELTIAAAAARAKEQDMSAPVTIAQRALQKAEADLQAAKNGLAEANLEWQPIAISSLAPARTIAAAKLASACLSVREACGELRKLDTLLIRQGLIPPAMLAPAEVDGLRRLAGDLARAHGWSRHAE
jgi:hypothetical protein